MVEDKITVSSFVPLLLPAQILIREQAALVQDPHSSCVPCLVFDVTLVESDLPRLPPFAVESARDISAAKGPPLNPPHVEFYFSFEFSLS